ncbi:hypothetical protein PR048_022452 [Dryococelus australis]|uniref:Uncharacterized protein n=1 Tax=Dryococelus australis TaxID=614101 RepID=A0ABQ9H144_9NEOP|nr:hypothetical protein PR048_022452 [Dryococelus australis]
MANRKTAKIMEEFARKISKRLEEFEEWIRENPQEFGCYNCPYLGKLEYRLDILWPTKGAHIEVPISPLHVTRLTFDEEDAGFGSDDEPAVAPRVAADDLVCEVRVEAVRLPGRALEEPRSREAGGRVALHDRVKLQGLPDPHELHLAGLLLATGAARSVREHVAECPTVQHRYGHNELWRTIWVPIACTDFCYNFRGTESANVCLLKEIRKLNCAKSGRQTRKTAAKRARSGELHRKSPPNRQVGSPYKFLLRSASASESVHTTPSRTKKNIIISRRSYWRHIDSTHGCSANQPRTSLQSNKFLDTTIERERERERQLLTLDEQELSELLGVAEDGRAWQGRPEQRHRLLRVQCEPVSAVVVPHVSHQREHICACSSRSHSWQVRARACQGCCKVTRIGSTRDEVVPRTHAHGSVNGRIPKKCIVLDVTIFVGTQSPTKYAAVPLSPLPLSSDATPPRLPITSAHPSVVMRHSRLPITSAHPSAVMRHSRLPITSAHPSVVMRHPAVYQ